MELKKPR